MYLELTNTINETTKMEKSTTSYKVRTKGMNGHFSQSGYSKYNERFSFQYKNDYPKGYEVYGLEQAKEHAEELRASIYEGRKINENDVFEIVQVQIIEEVILTKNK